MQRPDPKFSHPRVIRDEKDAAALFASIAARPLEVCAFAYLDPKWRLLGMRYTSSDLHDAITVPFREIFRDALVLDARMLVMAHNHPSGDSLPSPDDLRVTRRLAHSLDTIEVRLVDHLILTPNGSVSIRGEAFL